MINYIINGIIWNNNLRLGVKWKIVQIEITTCTRPCAYGRRKRDVRIMHECILSMRVRGHIL